LKKWQTRLKTTQGVMRDTGREKKENPKTITEKGKKKKRKKKTINKKTINLTTDANKAGGGGSRRRGFLKQTLTRVGRNGSPVKSGAKKQGKGKTGERHQFKRQKSRPGGRNWRDPISHTEKEGTSPRGSKIGGGQACVRQKGEGGGGPLTTGDPTKRTGGQGTHLLSQGGDMKKKRKKPVWGNSKGKKRVLRGWPSRCGRGAKKYGAKGMVFCRKSKGARHKESAKGPNT